MRILDHRHLLELLTLAAIPFQQKDPEGGPITIAIEDPADLLIVDLILQRARFLPPVGLTERDGGWVITLRPAA